MERVDHVYKVTGKEFDILQLITSLFTQGTRRTTSLMSLQLKTILGYVAPTGVYLRRMLLIKWWKGCYLIL